MVLIVNWALPLLYGFLKLGGQWLVETSRVQMDLKSDAGWPHNCKNKSWLSISSILALIGQPVDCTGSDSRSVWLLLVLLQRSVQPKLKPSSELCLDQSDFTQPNFSFLLFFSIACLGVVLEER
eukprot:TRINITY_DN109893_c0_g1_i1.p1 TRINITY_DN109893_c0_g1~~TRINITY_DN109893_c0_g1_i1.p1  ORF type:complete len:124 (+),score=17.70 TRINITY_DN109893_c0_g1_i1:95-466(+)